VLIAAQRCGPVRAVPIDDEQASTVRPIVDQYVDKDCHLMSDGHRTYISIGKHFSAHSYVTRSSGEYARGGTHSNTAESFVSFFERTRVGVFHFISDKHLSRYLHEATFRWDNRVPTEKKTPSGKKKVVMRPRQFKETLLILASRIAGIQLRRTDNWSIKDIAVA